MAPSAYNNVDPIEDESHQIISSYFIGPQAENIEFFKQTVNEILDAQEKARHDYFPGDGKFITEKVQDSIAFKHSTDKMLKALRTASNLMGKHSIPFWSPRYQGHMCMDLSMPALLGYFMTMIYNPNNVTIEVSPITTVAEIQVGLDFCKMFGFNVDPNNKELPMAWGHIACDGTVANLESMWAARNLKFYPFSLKTAMKEGHPLNFIAKDFKIEKCAGGKDLFMDLTNWDLLNLRPETILEIPQRLYEEFHVSTGFLDRVMKTYGVQSAGKSTLEKEYNLSDMKYFVSNAKHYSWPKSAAITGIGASQLIGIHVDNEARVDVADLDKKLQQCLDEKIAVYAVVAIMGSTEEGAVDPLTEIIQLREEYQKKGLSFLVHGDGAWGGYFCSMLPDPSDQPVNGGPLPIGLTPRDGFVPDFALRDKTAQDLYMLRYADSVTIDPHKAAYIPYPAGGLCYRDGRLKNLLTFTSPYISRGEMTATSIGVFGVEGSKPGAAVMSTWFSNACIGLNSKGYGALLGEVTFTCSRLSAEWAAMHNDDDHFIVIPLNLLPAEKIPGHTQQDIEKDRQRIKEQILQKTNTEIVKEDENREPADKALTLLRALGSDLNINAFSANWKYKDGTINKEVEEANYFNWLVIQDLSVDSPEDDPTEIPFFLTSTTFQLEDYGKCAQSFKKRLQLYEDNVDLVVMRNVVMSPWPTDGNFISQLIVEYRKVLDGHIETMWKRNDVSAAKYTFLVLGSDKIYAIDFPMFHLERHRHQLIIEVDLPEDVKKKYLEEQEKDLAGVYILKTEEDVNLAQLVSEKQSFRGSLEKRTACKHPKYEDHFDDIKIMSGFTVGVSDVIKDKSLKGRFRDSDYPTNIIPFYLFGTKDSLVIDHILVKSPNIQMAADDIKLDFEVPEEALKKGAILAVEGYSEAAMQPFASTEGTLQNTIARDSNFFFTPGNKLRVSVYEDDSSVDQSGPGLLDSILKPNKNTKSAKKLGSGTMTLSNGRFVDSVQINEDPYAQKEGSVKYEEWKKQFDSIGKDL